MLQHKSKIYISDNSGGIIVKCFYSLKKKKIFKIGDTCIGSIKKYKAFRQLKKKDIVKVLLLTTKKKIKKKDGSYLKFNLNKGICLNKESLKIIGSKNNTFLIKEFTKNWPFLKIISRKYL